MPQYQGIWSLQSAAQLQSTQRWVTDPSFDYTTLLLQADNAPDSAKNNTFIDSSSNNFIITRNGDTTQGTFTPFSQVPGAWSNYFGGSGSYLSNTSTALIGSTVSTFTAEAWVYMTAAPTSDANNIGSVVSLDGQANGTINYMAFGPISNQKIFLRWFDGAGKTCSGSTVLALNTWYHIAVVVNSNAISMYVNGLPETLSGTTTLTNRSGTINEFAVARNNYTSFFGYISNLRVTNTALYTSAFTPSTIPLTSPSGTLLLTCQSNRFFDANTQAAAKTLMPAGTATSVQAFSPFAPQYQWTAPVIGGSGYFDGTGDYLTVPDNANLRPPNGNFTYEIWWYPISLSGTQEIFTKDYGVQIYFAGGVMNCALSSNNSTSYFINASFGAPTLNSWNHIAVVRSGNDYYGYLNGVRTLLGTSTSFPDTGTGAVSIGAFNTGTLPSFGYLSGARYTTGALYTASPAAIPTSPPTTTVSAGTVQLLLNFTNAGIYDGTLKSNLTTIGNVQTSTSVVKYGTGSMYFSGGVNYLIGNFAAKDLYNFGTADFTVEMWVYTSNLAAFQTLIDTRSSDVQEAWALFIDNTGKPYWYDASGTQSSSAALSSNTWTHLAVSRAGSTIRIFLAGTQVFSGTNTNAQNSTGVFYVGRNIANSVSYTGYIDDLRITKGIARYITNFTPPTVALPRQ